MNEPLDPESIDTRRWFEEWRPIDDFRSRFDKVYEKLPAARQFGNNQTKWVSEAWIFSRICQIIAPSAVRIAKEDPPDAYIKLGEVEYSVEITRADKAGRQIALEYRSPQTVNCTHNDLDEAAIISLLNQSITSKANKKYPANTFLFIYLNRGFDYGQKSLIHRAIERTVKEKSEPFVGLCILWGNRVYCPKRITGDGPASLSFLDLEV